MSDRSRFELLESGAIGRHNRGSRTAAASALPPTSWLAGPMSDRQKRPVTQGVYANSGKHFATTNGTDTDRWYFGEFSSGGISVEFDALTTHLGEVEDWDEDEEPENSNAVDWLAAMTLAMRKAQTEGAFVFGGKNATIYCSMVDSLNAIWLEDVSAQFLNDADSYAAAANGIKAASADWYQSGRDQGSAAFRAAYESRLP